MPVPTADRARPTRDLDETLERFDQFSLALIRLEPFPLDEVRRSVERFRRAVNHHLLAARSAARDRPATPARPEGGRLEREHERFQASVDELGQLLLVVEDDDHGGHRQALGQYGRIFTEALRVHRRDELEEERRSPRKRGPARPGCPGQP